jgi:hypothetical protein
MHRSILRYSELAISAPQPSGTQRQLHMASNKNFDSIAFAGAEQRLGDRGLSMGGQKSTASSMGLQWLGDCKNVTALFAR